MDDKNLKLYSSHIISGKNGNPGKIIETTKKLSLLEQGSNDAIALTDMQLAGKRMLVANYLSGVQESLVAIDMMNSVRAHAFETIQHILNEGAYSNLKINEVLSSNIIADVDRNLY